MHGIMNKKTDKKEYLYTINLIPANILAILIMILLSISTIVIKKDLVLSDNPVLLILYFLGLIAWTFLHELLHGIGYVIGKAKKENVVYGIYIEKSICCTLCKQEVPKKTILLSLSLPFLVIGIVTYVTGFLINSGYLILLSIINISGAAMDIVMFLYILKQEKNITYAESDNPTAFYLISTDDLTKSKSMFLKIESVRDYNPKHFIFDKSKKITISKISKQVLMIIIVISILFLILYIV